MRWESWSQFWAMGGYGWYVWGSVGTTVLFLLLEIWQARMAFQNALALARTELELKGTP